MPRIPFAADVNPVGAAVSRLPTVRAEAEDFGVDVVKSLTEFGQATVYAVRETRIRQILKEELAKKKALREASEKQVAAAKAVVTQRAESNALINDMKGGEASTGLTAEEAIKQFDRSAEENLGALPAPQREAAKAAITPVREGHQVRALQSDNNIRVQKLIQETDGVLDSLEKLALQEPQSAEHYVMEGTALLQSLLDSGALTPEQFAGRSTAFRRSLYTKVVRAQPAADALADLEEGVYDQTLGDPDLKQFLQTETAWRLQSETAQGAAGAEGQMARLRRGEAVPGELSAATQRILQAGDMADAELQNERALRVRSELQKLRYAPEEEVAADIAALAPPADAVDAAERQKVQQEVWNQSQIMLRERRADPAAYLMGQPAVSAAFAAAEKNPALLPDAVAGRLAAQAALGLPPEEQNVLTKDERAQIRTGLLRLAPEQRIAALMELGNLYGDQNGAVAADLAEAGLSVSDLLAGDPSGGPEVAGQLVQAAENRGAAKAPEIGVIQEAAEELIAEGKEAADERVRQEEREGSEPREGNFLRVPPKKPMPRRIFDEQETLSRNRELLASDIDAKALNDAPNDLHLRHLIAQLGEQADQAGVSSELRQLAIKFGVQKLVVEGNGPPRAQRLAADEAGIEPLVPSRGYSFDNSAVRPREQKSALAEARTYLDAFKLDYQVDDEAVAAILLLPLREFWSIREATRLHGPTDFERRIDNLVQAGMKAGIDIRRDDVRDLAWAAIDDPFQHPWAQTEFELAASLKRLSEQVEAAGDVGLIQSIGGTLIDLAPAGGTLTKGAKKIGTLAYDLWGIGSALSTEEASSLLARLVKELLRRNGSPQ